MHAAVVFLAQLLLAGVRSSTPVLLVLLGETLTQRVGVINLGVEGEMLVGAAGGFAITAVTGNPWLGLVAAMLAGLLLSGAHALLCLGFKVNQIASGVCVLTLGSGLSAYYGAPYVGRQIAGFANPSGFASMPALAPLLAALTPTVVIALAITPMIGVWLYKTRTGLIWRTVGESTEAARMVGIKPWRVQLAGILAGGLLAGLGGAALSVDYTRTWVEGMTAGRGLVAVGLVVVARWNPWLALPAALLFGGSEALYLRLQSLGVTVSPYLLSTLPYLIPLAVLLGSYRSARRTGGMPQELTSIFKGVQ
ncbi:MAG TPA: ABC transporter permease [Steroidobacteraceae bacterium]|jgi:simple sugar transport system permease protein|nr:ABC transporter permease [Steroidobacteraceae bacterium]